MRPELIRDLVTVVTRPTVVRLDDLEAADNGWISQAFFLTDDVRAHLRAVDHALAQPSGTGVFLIGPYGSGKSHFLAYLVQRLAGRQGDAPGPAALTLSLLNFSADQSLEAIVAAVVGLELVAGDRRRQWEEVARSFPHGLVLVVDELSEFLRSKPSRPAFTEDVRFLQFLGEWARDHRLWVVAAMQEQIEHTGELESSLYRKIKDRFPLRLLLSGHHVRSLVADSILVKADGYAAATAELVEQARRALPGASLDLAALAELYPIHPTTLELLEEVRDLFSQTRGTVDFVLRRLAGDPAHDLAPFLDRPWGDLLTADAIVDHFADLFEVQPEFQPLAQTLLPYYRRHLAELFPKDGQQQLAWQLLKLLMLVHVSPQRDGLSAAEAAAWLLVRVTTVAPERNLAVVEKTLDKLAAGGRFVVARAGVYRLDLRDDTAERLADRLGREVAELGEAAPDAVWEILVGALGDDDFNPFTLPWDRWQARRVRWHQHERAWAVWLGNGEPGRGPQPGLSLVVRCPWSGAGPAPGVATLIPAQLTLDPGLVELAALLRLAVRPLDHDLAATVRRAVDERRKGLVAQLRAAFVEAELVSAEGGRESLRGVSPGARLGDWLDGLATVLLRQRYPSFERFAPTHGPLPKEAYHRLMTVAAEHDLGDYDGDDYVKLVREAYLVPMGLLSREGWYYRVAKNLDRHELVEQVMPLLEHRPSPTVIYDLLAAPVYGLVPDQIHLLLVFLLLQGEVDLVKAGRSYRDLYPTLPLPVHYDRVEIGSGLTADELKDLTTVAEAVNLRPPRQWSVTAQRQTVRRLAEAGQRRREALLPAVRRLEPVAPASPLLARLAEHAAQWELLEGDDDELRRFARFAHAIGSAAAFAREEAALDGLPARLDGAISDLKRLRHLLADPGLASWPEQAVTGRLAALGDAPEVADMAALEGWLQAARAAWEAYAVAYRRAHDQWWAESADLDLWTWQPPALATSRHLGLGGELETVERLRREAVELRCRGCSELEFRARCRCGFDGERAELSAVVDRFRAARRGLEVAVEAFFATAEVRARVRQWQEQGVEPTTALMPYLAGDRSLPEVSDVAAFDRFLAGVEVVREVPLEQLTEVLGERTWERGQLVAALTRAVEALGLERFRFTSRAPAPSGSRLAAWCVEQGLRHGVALPAEVGRDAAAVVPRPDWVSTSALARLEQLGLGDELEDRILAWVVDGTLGASDGGSPLVAAAREVAHPTAAAGVEGLARLATTLYRAAPRLLRVAGDLIRVRLSTLAETPLAVAPPPLTAVLEGHRDDQWLVVDALGLPLLEVALALLPRVFPGWRVGRVAAATVAARTTTERFFADLAAAGVVHRLTKVNCVDRLLHERQLSFADLERLAAAELEVALRRVELDPARGLLVVADHGFRLDADGYTFVHGGASTLERVVPVIVLARVSG